VIEGVLLVLATYLIGSLLFDRSVGVLGALGLATTPITVYISHVATADGLANLLFWLAALAALRSWRCGGRGALAVSIFLAGMAAGAKTDHVLIVLLVALAYAWSERKRRRDVALFLLLPAGYAVANPVLLLRPFAFVDGITRDMFFGSSMNNGSQNSWAILLRMLWLDIGWPVGLLAIAALGYAVLQIVRGRDRRELSWLLASFVPYCLITGSKNVSPWYLGQLMPGLTLLAAYAATRVPQQLPRGRRIIAHGALALLYGLALLGPVSLDLQFTHDPRDAATRWIETHAPAGATIFESERAPKLPTRYRVETLVADRERWKDSEFPVARMDRDPLYRRVRGSILAAERWSGATLHTPVRNAPYRGWYDAVLSELDERPAGTARVMQARPDFVVVVQGMSPTLSNWLRTPPSGYVEVASFGYRSPVRPNLRMPMVNQRAFVFQRRR
jgi:hypothetical protein